MPFGRRSELEGTVPLLLDIYFRDTPSCRRDHDAQTFSYATYTVCLETSILVDLFTFLSPSAPNE